MTKMLPAPPVSGFPWGLLAQGILLILSIVEEWLKDDDKKK
jgi:hypothetical protein